ncbi:TPA: radical SAM protein [Methanosarcina acetivorans]|uniref:Tungsten-containing aldehyde ferredoxin oxidoreductase cofactor modifying protein n=3 Tax=Methanosarcina TaxID=2207 RepID=Q8TR79_METAC|nr:MULTISPECIES: radical SAM protein [Methanosarcina]AAM04721.1 tungsten-containing aldehyde ferredoxin oxidoreductase cofactor modifying protein [Methanosarcina acetivorans C2A]AKB35583.1 Radical SAM domain heme biosynthesis protein [Methanosarcina siciliae C2J]HIH94950.1 radical SAM protein [Methanosarcina acetivorans]
MIIFKNEQYLPCSIPEISYTYERKVISDKEAPLYLREDLFVYPMNAGFIVENNNGQFLTDSIGLLQLIRGKSVNDLCHNEKDLEEIEQYYRYGLIGYEKNTTAKLVIPEVSQKYFDFYESSQTTWFCHIPLKIELDITKKCNFHCKHCSREASPTTTEGEMSLQNYVDVIQQAGKIGIPEFSFMGGEPTCNPSFIELATIARMSGIRTLSTSTNGWLINEELAKKIAILFDSVQVSIHGADSETHDAIVGRPGAFSQACKAIELLKKHNVSSLNISCTVMNENAHQMEAMIQLARDLQVESIRFLVLFSKGRGSQLSQWKKEEKTEMANNLKTLSDKNINNLKVESGGFPPYYKIGNNAAIYGCPAGRSLMYISADGDVRACGNLDHTIGNIRDMKIMDLWHSDTMISLRKKPACDCPYTDICAGGCLANEYWSKMFNINITPIMT